MANPRTQVMVPIDADTVIAGAREVKNRLSAELGQRGLADEIHIVELLYLLVDGAPIARELGLERRQGPGRLDGGVRGLLGSPAQWRRRRR